MMHDGLFRAEQTVNAVVLSGESGLVINEEQQSQAETLTNI